MAKGVVNHFNILALRTPWTVWKGKKKRTLVFPILLFSSVSLHCSFKKAFLSLLAILCNSMFSWVYFPLSPLPLVLFFTRLFVKASSDNHFVLDFFPLRWFWSLPPVQCYEPQSIVLQVLQEMKQRDIT